MKKNVVNSSQVSSSFGKSKKKKFRFSDFIALMIILTIVVIGGLWIKDYISFLLLDFTTAEVGTLENKCPVKAIVLRHEALFTAPASGTFQSIIKENERVTKGTIIGYIQNNNDRIPVYAPKAGIIIYQLDEYEDKLSLADAEDIDFDKLFEFYPFVTASKVDEKPNLAQGRPLGKVVDNLLDFTVIMSFDKKAEIPKEGWVDFYPYESTAFLSGKIKDYLETDKAQYLTLKVSSKEDMLVYKRYFEADLILNELKGSIIPTSALASLKDGSKVVYYKGNTQIEVLPVELLGIVGQQAVVKEIDPFKELVVNSQNTYPGQKTY